MFRGRSVQLIIRDIRLTESVRRCNARDIAVYSAFMSGGTITPRQANHIAPCRNEQVAVWRYISANSADGDFRCPPEDVALRIRTERGIPLNVGKLLVCCAIFAEFHLMEFSYDGEVMKVKLPQECLKRDISGSRIMARLRERSPRCNNFVYFRVFWR